MGTYRTSSGERVKKSVIDRRVREAKKQKLANQLETWGYNFCEDCFRNDDLPLDCSHNISVDQCQKMGRSELAWDLENITIRGRGCHNIHDDSNLRFSNGVEKY